MRFCVELEEKDIEVIESVVDRYKEITRFPKEGLYKRCTDEELWQKLVSQFVVVGRADRVHKLDMNALSLSVLEGFSEPQSMLYHINKVLAEAGVRYVASGRISNKARFLEFTYNKFFRNKAKLGLLEGLPEVEGLSYGERRALEVKARRRITKSIKGFGLKSSSDFLIKVGYAKTLMVFDTRVIGFINKVLKPETPVESIGSTVYLVLEEAFQKVYDELGIYPFQLDRVLFQNYKSIIEAFSHG